MEISQLKSEKKGNTYPYFKEGMIPSIIYGGNTDPIMVAVDTIQLKKKDLMRVASTQKYLKSNLVIKKKQLLSKVFKDIKLNTTPYM